jgi:hypothetical protein
MVRRQYHRNVIYYNIWYLTAVICDEREFVHPITLPRSKSDWAPFESRVHFELAEFLFSRNQMPATQIDILLKLWGATLAEHGDAAPFSDHRDLYATIDSIPFGDAPWESFNVVHTGDKPSRDIPSWMTAKYDVWLRNPLLRLCGPLGPSFTVFRLFLTLCYDLGSLSLASPLHLSSRGCAMLFWTCT